MMMADAFQIDNGKVKGVRFVPAASSGGALTPTLIIVHDTAGHTKPFSSVNWFASKSCKTSAHFVVEMDGTVTQMVPTNRRAFHAGKSKWNGRTFCNSFGVGIEIVNPGKLRKVGDEAHLIYVVNGKEKIVQRFPVASCVHKKTKEHGDGWWLPYTPAQILSVKKLCRAIMEEYPDCNEIVTHWMISPGRKVDTNPLFPMAEVLAYAEGLDDDPKEAPSHIPQTPIPVPIPAPPMGAREMAKVSRKVRGLVWIRDAIKSFFGIFSFVWIMDALGYIKGVYNEVFSMVQDNALALGLTTGILALGVISWLISLIREDQSRGTYVPSGLVAGMDSRSPGADNDLRLDKDAQPSGVDLESDGDVSAPIQA